jgi:hypothetical protein
VHLVTAMGLHLQCCFSASRLHLVTIATVTPGLGLPSTDYLDELLSHTTRPQKKGLRLTGFTII